jgi:hypothetical protein
MKKVDKTPKKPTMLDRLPKNEIERLELMIRMTEKHINPNGSDKTMANQAERLRAQLEELKKNS